ncbi:MAG: cupredoxin domain-containing protein [Thermomicrobiales bacterium]
MLKKLSMFALIGIISVMALAACGSGDDGDKVEPTVTRVPATNAPADATFFTPTPEAAAATETVAAPTEASPAASPISSGASPVAASPAADIAASPAVTQAAAGATALSVTTGDLFFDPKALAGAAGVDVVVTITNNGALAHDFSIPDLGITSKMLNPGESTTVTVNAPAGEYQFICTVPGHADAGMTGTLTLS